MAIYNGALTVIDEKELIRYAGLSHAEAFPEEYIKQAMKEIRLISEPKGIYQVYDYDCLTHTILSDPPLFLEGTSIQDHLKESEKVYLMSVTIGEAVEDRIRQLFDSNEYTLGVLLDAAATTAVEQVADQVNAIINNAAKKSGYEVTWRFSPGYGNWPIEVQAKLAKSIKTEQIGVHVLPSMALYPRKSVTAIIGCRSKKESLTVRGCPSCTMQQTCDYSKIKK